MGHYRFGLFYYSLRDIKITYNHIKNIQSRAETILKDLAKKNVLTTDICQEIVAAKSLDELDHLVRAISESVKDDWNIEIKNWSSNVKNNNNFFFTFLDSWSNYILRQYAPYKTDSKTTLAERAKALGLEEVTLKILSGDVNRPNLTKFVNKSVEGLESVEKVRDGIQHIIAQIFSKETAVLETISEM